MNIILETVSTEQMEMLKNFYALYLHDLSEFSPILHPNENGFFEFDAFELIYNRDELSPYFIKYEEKYVGFLLFAKSPFTAPETDFCINDLFLLKAYRGKKIADQAILELLKQHKGTYYVMQLKNNKTAVNFWKKFYQKNEIKYQEVEKISDDELCLTQTFTVPSLLFKS
ncbi:GNAT family N-acetyltransferase [Bacillus pseudomycoides]|uniref:GNAT family N-acetyltransferase n=1 Tax=Bacillus pseudomycoides TaxID=64104 RepID=UPI000BEB8DD7|nr:GNAT family N-acetyltransferase [Bacillus pseudomycoides]PED05509.1 GNAT family N-acetyltransferase [Bacillus pseudomycoides]PEI96933.1 GNAT family N-acetyltransferase [Bacillus pseudomycoides]PEK23550.1 GNAT family N-acetyltransferase [Bacillus pseudomycoides]PEM64338.1 GNAT family N-acetyltransferase [Bacillus pseudomycoides]PEO22763.1 GNAT family N-acetyltransferase [Bacillus pseudomycoides]